MQNETEEVNTRFELPDHGNELSLAEEKIEKLKCELKIIVKEKSITDESHDKIYENTIRALDFVGKLSLPAFALEDEIQEYYTKTYIHAPQLAKRLWLDHYGKLHQPFQIHCPGSVCFGRFYFEGYSVECRKVPQTLT